jgi:hypothetical protein
MMPAPYSRRCPSSPAPPACWVERNGATRPEVCNRAGQEGGKETETKTEREREGREGGEERVNEIDR